MRFAFGLLSSSLLAALIVGCGSGTPTGPTLAPGATATLPPVATSVTTAGPTGGTAVTGHECDGIPTFSLSNPNPSFTPDAALLAKYPTTVDNQPVSDATAFPWVDLLCMGGQAAFNSSAAESGGLNLAAMSFGSFTANVDGEDVEVAAFRQPGVDGNVLAQTLASLATAAGNTVDMNGVTTANVAGKNVYTWTDSDGNRGYGYVSGDTLFTFDSVTDSQATKILSALP